MKRKIAGTGRIWIHAVSVGEVNIAMKLIQALRESDSSLEFVLSTTTSTGFKLAATRKTSWLEPIYNPVDFYPVARRAMRLIRPRVLILVEAEVWPNCVCEAKKINCPVVLVNAPLLALPCSMAALPMRLTLGHGNTIHSQPHPLSTA